jgi:flagellar hook-length control protein FliK
LGAGKPNLGKPGWTTLAAQRAAQSNGTEPRSSEAQKAPVLMDAAQTSGAAALADGLLQQGPQAVQAALGTSHLGPFAQGGAARAAAALGASGNGEGMDRTEGTSDAPGAGLTLGTATRQRDASSYGGGRDHSAGAAGWQVDASGASASGSTGTEAFADALQHADVQQMAEQVSLWVASGVKEAELQIDQLGQEPVLVSISMDGARADVVFRSDEAGAREALSQSMAQLQALMQQEGLTLGSMSVGTQGRPSSDGAPNRGAGAALRLEKSGAGPQGLHPALDRAIDQALSASSGRPGGVDVFV